MFINYKTLDKDLSKKILLIYLLLERGEGKEKEKERNIDV